MTISADLKSEVREMLIFIMVFSELAIMSLIWVEIGLLIIMGGIILGFFINRHVQEKGLGARAIQFLVAVLTIPAILFLAVNEILGPQSTAALIGTVVGFVLSGFSYESSESS